MKILIVTHYFNPHIGGIEVVAYNQAKELIRRGHKVTIITSKLNNEKNNEQIEGINIVRVKAWNWLEKNFDVPFPIFSLRLLSILNTEIKKADVVHTHGALYMGSFFGSFIAGICKKPFIVTEHVGFVVYTNFIVNIIQKLAFKTIGRITLNKSYKVLVLNKNVQVFLSKITKTKIEYLINGVDINLFKPATQKQKILLRKKYKLPPDKKLALFVGRFVSKKGIDLLIKAKTPNFDIVLVGEGKLPKETYDTKGIFIFGFLPQNKLKEIYQACDLFVLPSTGEGFPLSLQEAMASGLPIITTKQQYYKELFDINLVKLIDRDINQIKNSIQNILSNTKEVDSMKNYSRKFVVNEFSWKVHINKLLKIYGEVKNEKN